jgi:hypothetical protein
MDTFPTKGVCECCEKVKNERTKKSIGKKFFLLCDECIESLKWTQACLKSGTNKLLEKCPDKYERVSNFSVQAIE